MCLPFTGSQIASFLWRLDAGEKTIYATEVGPDGFGKRFGKHARSCLAMINSWLLAPEILDHQISCCRPSKVTLLAMACRTMSAVDQSWICTPCMAMLIGRSELVTSIDLVSCVLHNTRLLLRGLGAISRVAGSLGYGFRTQSHNISHISQSNFSHALVIAFPCLCLQVEKPSERFRHFYICSLGWGGVGQ